MDATAVEVGLYFAHLSLEHGAHRVHMPIAFEAMSVATTSRNVELIGQMGGQTNAVAVEGSYVYIGVGPRLMVLDVSDPASPTPVGQSAVLPDIVWDIHVAGRHAYLATRDGGLRVIDVSDPTAPAEVGAYAVPGFATENFGFRISDCFRQKHVAPVASVAWLSVAWLPVLP